LIGLNGITEKVLRGISEIAPIGFFDTYSRPEFEGGNWCYLNKRVPYEIIRPTIITQSCLGICQGIGHFLPHVVGDPVRMTSWIFDYVFVVVNYRIGLGSDVRDDQWCDWIQINSGAQWSSVFTVGITQSYSFLIGITQGLPECNFIRNSVSGVKPEI